MFVYPPLKLLVFDIFMEIIGNYASSQDSESPSDDEYQHQLTTNVGDWHTFTFIKLQVNSLGDLAQTISSKTNAVPILTKDMHLTTSKVNVFKKHQVQALLTSLSTALGEISCFYITPKRLMCLKNGSGASFIVLEYEGNSM